jgi:hypothetical protein
MTAVTQPASRDEQPTRPTKIHTVQGGGGLRLHVREWGPGGPTGDPVHPRHLAEPPLLG